MDAGGDVTNPVRVLLLFGGRSAEHDVSCTSAVSVARALDPTRYDVVPVAITTEGRWLLAADAQLALAKGTDFPERFTADGEPVELRTGADGPELVPTAGGDGLPIDVVFPLLHGPYGEDGTVQGFLELLDLPYVGSGVASSAVGMDKVLMKRVFAGAGLPLAPYRAVRSHEWSAEMGDTVVAELGLPVFVKPANMGSSIGVSKAATRADLDSAVELALRFDDTAVCETAIVGREIEVAVLGDADPAASVPGEIVPGAEFYSYADKYEDDAAQLLAPAPLSGTEAAEARRLALAVFEAVRCSGMARVDFFFESPGRGFIVNEVNTIPGFTAISMFPRLWELSGVPYPELCDRLIAIALERHAARVGRAGRQRWE